MADSIRERIFQSVKTALELIKGAPDYNITIDPNSINIVHGTREEYDTPNIYIYPSIESVDIEKAEKGKIFKTISIELEMWLKAKSKDELNVLVNRGLADMEKALMVDPHRGDLAIDTRLVSSDVFIESIGTDKAGVILSIEVDYQQSYGDPTVC